MCAGLSGGVSERGPQGGSRGAPGSRTGPFSSSRARPLEQPGGRSRTGSVMIETVSFCYTCLHAFRSLRLKIGVSPPHTSLLFAVFCTLQPRNKPGVESRVFLQWQSSSFIPITQNLFPHPQTPEISFARTSQLSP